MAADLGDIAGYSVLGLGVIGLGINLVSKLSKSLSSDRAAEKLTDTGGNLLEHYAKRTEELTEKIDEVISINSELSKTNSKLVGEISQLILQMRVYSELLMHYTKMAEEGKLPSQLLGNLAQTMYRASEPFTERMDN